MNKKIMIASIVAVLASPLALARGHTQDIYGGVDIGSATQAEQGAFCNSMAVANGLVADPDDNNSTVSVTLNVGVTNNSCEDAETPLRLFAGYKISDMISVEGFWMSSSGYASNQDIAVTLKSNGGTYNTQKVVNVSGVTSETDYTSFGLSAVGKYEVYDNLSLKGVLGLHSYSVESSFTPPFGATLPSTVAQEDADVIGGHLERVTAARNDDGVSLLYGIGAEYDLGDNFNVRAGYDVLSSGDDSVSYLSAGASYTYSF